MLPFTLLFLVLLRFSAAALTTSTIPATSRSTILSSISTSPSKTTDGAIVNVAVASVPNYEPAVTAPADQDAALASKGYAQTTFYKCETRRAGETCGWHVPVVKVEEDAARAAGTGWAALGVGVVAVGFVMGLA